MTLILLTAASVVAYSVMALLYKAAAPLVRPERMVWVATLIATVLGFGVWLLSGEFAPWIAIVLGGVAGLTFYFASILRARAVQTSPLSLVFAITNLDLVLAGAITMLIPWFNNPPTLLKIMACGLAALAVLLGGRISGKERLSPLTFASLGLLIVSQLALLAYARNWPAALFLLLFVDHVVGLVPTPQYALGLRRSEWLWGLGVGLSMFAGVWMMLKAQALAGDQLTAVLLGLSLKTPLIAVISIPVFKEELTGKKIVALVLASLALIIPLFG